MGVIGIENQNIVIANIGQYSNLGYSILGWTIGAMHKRVAAKHWAQLLRLLREARLEAGLRQTDLAKALGQSQSFVSKYESGERRLDLIEIREICETLGIPFSTFINRFEQATQ